MIFFIIGLWNLNIFPENELSSMMFIRGNYFSHTGQDTIARYYYEEAYRADTGSLILKELYGSCLIKTGYPSIGTTLLRKVAYSYIEMEDWKKALSVMKPIYEITHGYSDGCTLAFIAYQWGNTENDPSKIEKAKIIWEYLSQKASLNNHADSLNYVLEYQRKTLNQK